MFAMMLRNQQANAKRFPTNADIDRMLQPEDPLKEDAVRSILDMMRDDWACRWTTSRRRVC